MIKTGRFTLSKSERVSGKTRVENIFISGKAFLTYPFRVVYLEYNQDNTTISPSILISIPKKRLKRAVDRNRMKRLVREVYRLNKHNLDIVQQSEEKGVDIAIIYVADKLLPYSVVEKALVRALLEVSKRLKNS